jgi:hypothetical protein
MWDLKLFFFKKMLQEIYVLLSTILLLLPLPPLLPPRLPLLRSAKRKLVECLLGY